MKKFLYKFNTIRNNLILIPSIFFLFLMVFVLITSYHVFYNFLYQERIDQIKYVIDVVGVEFNQKEEAIKKGEITRANAEAEMINLVSKVKFGDNSYIWVNDKDGIFKYHPTKSLIGKNIQVFNDKNDSNFGTKMYNIIKKQGDGFVLYAWNKPGSSKQYPKTSYIKMYKDFGWAISAGVYIDDIERKVFISLLTSFIPILLFLFVFVILLRRIILSQIIIPIEKMTDVSQQIVKGEYSIFLPDTQRNLVEVENLIEAFKQFVLLAKTDKHNQNKISTILNNISDGLLILDENYFIESSNIASENMFGYSEADILKKDVKTLIPLLSFDDLELNTNLYGHTHDEKVFPLEVLVNVIYFEGRKLYILILRDITKEKEVEKTKNEFISMISHELRTPLTSIRGSLGLIISGVLGALPPKVLELTNIANNNCVRLVNLINDILDMEKIKAGKMTFEIKEHDIVAILKDSVKMNEAYAKQYNVQFSLIEKIEQGFVNIDKDRIIQVLTNLLSNAAKFSKENSFVNVSAKRKDTSILIEIEDTGIGIPKEFHSKLFQSFSQVDSSDTRKKGGTGLGLLICKEIIEKLGGKLSFESTESVGTSFYVELPEIIKKEGPKKSVLICEDNQMGASYLKIFFEKLNYVADIASSLNETQQLLHQKDYDLMTLDIFLPDGNGLDFLKEMRKEDKYKNLPVIVVSASEEKEPENIQEYKITQWIDKSFDFDQLENTIKILLDEQKESKFEILHLDDDTDILQVTELTLKNIANTTKALTIKNAKELISTKSFELIILDYKLPDGDCGELIDFIKNSINKNAKLIIFSAYEIGQEFYEKVDIVFLKTLISNDKFAKSVEELLISK